MKMNTPTLQKTTTIVSNKKRSKKQNIELAAFLFLLPSLIGFLVFYIIPAFRGVYLSLTDWDLLGDPNFIGLQNYKDLLSDKAFWNSLLVTIKYVLWNIPFQTILALGIALVMDRVISSSVFRGMLLIPWLLPNVVVALLWLWLLDPAVGVINSTIDALGGTPLNFLTSIELALPSIAGINIWRHMGYTALIVFAGLQGIPKEVEEAALIDGASPWIRFTKIIIPYLRPVLAFVIITSVIGSFQVFDTVAITTKGGPVTATYVIYLFIYKNGFENYLMGYATAASMILFLILLGISFIQMRVMRANESDF
ncbi:MAG: carbohydrate ABC transporter permease [Pleomorphochaeta sp.]